MIYLDNNATTRVLPEVREAMLPYFSEDFFNPSSPAGALYDLGKPLRDAASNVAMLIDCDPEEVVLTSGATESNNWVLKSIATRALRQNGTCYMLASEIEHPSILGVIAFLRETEPGFEADLIPVTGDGIIDLEAYRRLVRPETVLVSAMLANNETGVIQPVAEMASIAKAACSSCLFHTDATQAVGKTDVSLRTSLELVDFLSLSAHKFHGPKGIGALYIRSGLELDPLLHGGGQQGGARSGTENPALASGLAKAAEKALDGMNTDGLSSIRNWMEAELIGIGAKVLGRSSPRLPNTTLLLFEGFDAEMLIHQLLEAGFVTSTGSACSAGSDRPSGVVLAMGIGFDQASSVIRVSLSRENTLDHIREFVNKARDLVAVLHPL